MELKKQAYGLIIVTMFSGWLQQDNFWTEQRCQFFGWKSLNGFRINQQKSVQDFREVR